MVLRDLTFSQHVKQLRQVRLFRQMKNDEKRVKTYLSETGDSFGWVQHSFESVEAHRTSRSGHVFHLSDRRWLNAAWVLGLLWLHSLLRIAKGSAEDDFREWGLLLYNIVSTSYEFASTHA